MSTLRCWPCKARKVGEGEPVSRAIVDLAEEFARLMGEQPEYAFVHDIPPKAAEGAEVRGIMLIRSALVPVGWVAVTRADARIYA